MVALCNVGRHIRDEMLTTAPKVLETKEIERTEVRLNKRRGSKCDTGKHREGQAMTTATTTTPIRVGTWAIDPAHSSIDFSVRHLMVSKIRGTFETFSG